MRNFLTNFQIFSQSFGLFENWLYKIAHRQPPILASFKPESIMACAHLLQGTCRPPLGSEFNFDLNKVGSRQCGIGKYDLVCGILKECVLKQSNHLPHFSLLPFFWYGIRYLVLNA